LLQLEINSDKKTKDKYW